MSALTFATLSAELAQTLAEQPDTPPAATVRCTLGRGRVLVLVEYPLDSAQAELTSEQTLDWLEQYLRHYFDTTGLPEETADLAAAGETVAVRLYLKHFSEVKPFTMRSFVWKVDDGFEDVFGGLLASPAVAEAAAEQAMETAIEATAVETTAETAAEIPVASDRPYTDWMGRELVFHAASESIAEHLLPDAEEDERVLAELEEEYLDLELEAETELDLDPKLGSDWEAMIAPDEVALETGSDWETDLDLHTAYAPPELSDLDIAAVDLPERPAAEPSATDFFSLDDPESDANRLSAQSDSSLAAELEEALEKASKRSFAVDDAAAESAGDRLPDDIFAEVDADDSELINRELTEGDRSEPPSAADLFDLEQVLSDQANLWDAGGSAVASGEAEFGRSAASEPIDIASEPVASNPIESDLAGGDSVDSGLTDLDLTDSDLAAAEPDDWLVGAQSGYVQPESAQAEKDMDAETDYLAALESADFEPEDSEPEDFEPEDFESVKSAQRAHDADEHEPGEHEPDEYEPDEYEPEDAAYFLAHDGDEDEPFEAVAAVDEREVQRQGEQWQQSRGDARIFVGALGFVVIGVLGFVLTRPCGFGQCDRIQVAQAQGDEAMASLRLDDSLAGVDQSRAELKRAIALLKPIPPWSQYHSQARQILPAYQDQIGALDQVSVAQDRAYQAAVNSQDPPHPISTWNQVAADWRAAIRALEAVPPSSLVRDLAERKLVEYRANLSTIKLRIDAETKAEESLRQAQQAASLGTQQAERAESVADWETALASWESAVNNLRQIPQGTQAYSEAQTLLSDYQQAVKAVRDRTQQARSDSRRLSQAKQLAAAAQQDEADEQWSSATQKWTAAIAQLKAVSQETEPHTEAQSLLSLYTSALGKAENNLAVALRFRPVEPRFFMACGTTNGQKCTYSMQGGNVRLDLFQGYDSVINQSITPPDQRADITSTAQLVSQANQLLKDVTVLSTQAQVPLKLYDAKGDFLASYQPDLNGFVR